MFHTTFIKNVMTNGKLRQFPAPLCQAHIKRDWDLATREVSEDGRLIQRSFWRAFRRDAKGDIDDSLIPECLVAWYANSSDEEDTTEEVDNDVEVDKDSVPS